MGIEGAVDCDEPQSLDLTLREQHPVERIARRRLGFDGNQRVAFIDRDNPDAEAVEKLGQGAEFVCNFSLLSRHLIAISQRLAALR